jgi:regulator of RNase E activity RraA
MVYCRMTDTLTLIRKARLGTSTIADVLDAMGIDGVLPAEIRSRNVATHHVVGYAYTVHWVQTRKTHDILAPQPSTWDQVREFLVPDVTQGRDQVYVAGAGPLLTCAALAGGMSATYFARLGFEGIVLGGAVRDIHDVKRLEMPVLATNACPTDTQGCYRVAAVGDSCLIASTIVRSGDVIVSDETGTVSIPREQLDEVVEKALRIEEIEAQILSDIELGKSLPALIAQRGRI